jgi:hypothetical protein
MNGIVAVAQAEEDMTATITNREVETTTLNPEQEEDDVSVGAGAGAEPRKNGASSPEWTTWPRVYSAELLIQLLTRYCTTSSSNTDHVHRSSVRGLGACYRMRWKLALIFFPNFCLLFALLLKITVQVREISALIPSTTAIINPCHFVAIPEMSRFVCFVFFEL